MPLGTHRPARWLLALGLTCTSCLAESIAVDPAPVDPNAPAVTRVEAMPGPDVTVSVRSIAPVRNVERAFVLPSDGLLVSTSTTVLYLPGPGADPVDLGVELGAVTSVVSLLDGRQLLASRNGVFVFQIGTLERSPVSEVLTGSTAISLLTTPGVQGGADVWIGTASGLHLWRDGRLFTVEAAGLPTAAPQMVFGAPAMDALAIWVASASSLYALVTAGDGITVHPDLSDDALGATSVDGLGVDGEGTLWMAAGGLLRSRAFDGRWVEHGLIDGARTVAALPSAPGAWIQASDGLWRHLRGTLSRAPDAPAGSLVAISPSGYAVIANADGLFRIETGREVALDGLDNGVLVSETTQVLIRPPDPEKVDQVTAAIDGRPIDVLLFPQRIQLDPDDLDDGFHTLTVNVTYRDGGPDGHARVGFFIGLASMPTWRAEVEPLSSDKCATCHFPAGNAHDLTTRQQWCDDMPRVVVALRDGRMPLPPNPPLAEMTVQRLELWKGAGCPE